LPANSYLFLVNLTTCCAESGGAELVNIGVAEHVGRGILRFSAVFFGSAGQLF
jgi:hypothetical protein